MKVEGVEYEVNWKAFTRGRSLFFPCLDYDRARRELRGFFKRLRIKVEMHGVVHEGVKGLRIWRL